MSVAERPFDDPTPGPPELEAEAGARAVAAAGTVVRLGAGRSDGGRADDRSSLKRRVQRGIDIVIAAVALIILAPIALLIAIAVRVDSRGPILYRQLRIGLDRRRGREDDRYRSRRTADLGGCPFTLVKFRTMYVNAERDTGPIWASPDDERVTPVGRFLRRYRLDEIPQFWNVLRGDMAIVGPRPERPKFVRMFCDELDGYGLRHRVRPGITGWAQVHQEPDQTIDDVRNKLQYDLEYLDRRSLSLDLRIMLRTVPVMLDRIRRNE